MIDKINCLAIVANGSEDSELITCVDLIKRSGGSFKYCSLDEKIVTLSHGTKIESDLMFDPNSNYEDFNLIFIPGGKMGVLRMYESNELLKLIKNFHDSNRFVSAICAGPTVLDKAKILSNHKFTCYDSWEEKTSVISNYVNKAPSVVSGNVITGRSVNYVIEFTLDIVEAMLGKNERLQLEKQILR